MRETAIPLARCVAIHDATRVRLASWNVNGIRARLDHVLEWLAERTPDVVGLQEIKSEAAGFPAAAFAAAGYQVALHSQKAWNGVAILSRHPIENIECGLPGREEQGARLITACTAGLEFTSVYIPNGKTLEHPDYPLKLEWLAALREQLARPPATGAPRVVVGDFNVCPSPLDTWNEAAFHGQIFHTDAERSAIAALHATGLVDAWRLVHPDEPGFSWWDYRDGALHRGHGLRIDFVLLGEALRGRVERAEVDRDYRKKREGRTPSDHAPVIVDLRGGA